MNCPPLLELISKYFQSRMPEATGPSPLTALACQCGRGGRDSPPGFVYPPLLCRTGRCSPPWSVLPAPPVAPVPWSGPPDPRRRCPFTVGAPRGTSDARNAPGAAAAGACVARRLGGSRSAVLAPRPCVRARAPAAGRECAHPLRDILVAAPATKGLGERPV